MSSSAPFFSAESLSLAAALTTAVVALWRRVLAKDQQILDLTAEIVKNAAVIQSATEAIERLRLEGCARGWPASSAIDESPSTKPSG